MKPKLLCLLCCIVFMYACGNEKEKSTTTNNVTADKSMEKEEPAQLTDLTDAMPYAEIEVQDARDMIRKYLTSKRYVRHSLGTSGWRDDTRAVVFDSSFVRKLYETMQCEKATGIRVYFGIYDKPKYGREQLFKTVIITTTYDSTVLDRSGNPVRIYKDNLKNTCATKTEYWKSMNAIENKGGLCPPPDDSCAYYGALLLPPGY